MTLDFNARPRPGRGAALAALTLATAPAAAAQTPITDPGGFDGCEVLVDFEGLATPVTDDLAALGVSFALVGGSGAGVLAVDDVLFPREFGPAGSDALVNSAAPLGACPCTGVQIDFAAGVLRAGFEVRNDELDDVQISLFAGATPVGLPQVFASGAIWRFVGLESATPFDRVLVEAVGGGAGALQLDNLRFEFPGGLASDGFDGAALDAAWSQAGAAGTVGASFGVTPPSGTGQGLLANGAGVGAPGVPVAPATLAALVGASESALEDLAPGGPMIVGSGIARTLEVAPGDRLEFHWNFLTNESTPDADFNDFAFVTLGGAALLLADTNSAGFVSSGSSFQQETGWRSFVHEFTVAGTLTFGLGVVDVEDASTPGFESALLIDCLSLDGAPVANQPPTCSSDLAAAREAFLEVAPGAFVVTEGETFVVPFTGVDPEGGQLTASAALVPGAGLSPTAGMSPLTSVLAFTPSAADKAGAPYVFAVTFVDDGGLASTCEVVVDDVNLNPICDAGGGGSIEIAADGPEGALVQLSGSASDPDDLPADLQFLWSASDASVIFDDPTRADPVAIFPVGVTLATLTVSDGRGGMSTCDVSVVVSDLTPPAISCTTSVASLWPPKHDMRCVKLYVQASDETANPDAIQILSATLRSDEPDNAYGWGDGHTTGDVNGLDGFSAPVPVAHLFAPVPGYPGLFKATVLLRAERAGNGDGRVYTFEVTASDEGGNTSSASCVVVVPLNQKKKGCGP
jgi:hypothetical protein